MRIIFCGVGALGSTAAMLCRNLEASLVFVDFDRVESKNLLAQVFVKQSVGKNKAEALKLQLTSFYGKKVEAFGVRLDKDNVQTVCAQADLLVDAFDNQESRIMLSNYAKHANKSLVHAAVSADGTFGMVRWDARFIPDAEDVVGQPTCEGGEHLPMIGLIASTLARSIQDNLRDKSQWDAMVGMSQVVNTMPPSIGRRPR